MAEKSSFFRDALRISLQSIAEQKLRAFLTLIGIIIGVAAVVIVGASISGLNTYVSESVTKILGSNRFLITRLASTGRLSEEEYERRNRLNKHIEWSEFEWIRDNCRKCSAVGAQMNGATDLSEDGVELPATRVLGVTHSMFEVEEKDLSEGRAFSSSEDSRGANVCVIGNDVRERLFPVGSPLGRRLKIRGVQFTVIGSEAPRGSFFGDSMDRLVYIPVSTFRQLFGREGLQIHGKGSDKASLEAALAESMQLLRNKRRLIGEQEDNFSVMNSDEIGRQTEQITGQIAAVVVPVTLIILVVGGIVVMNIMLVTVTERTFEVGLRKALGASRRQILLQFLIESSVLCSAGGMIGLATAAVATLGISAAIGITMTITPGYVLLALFVSSSIGILAGLYPAWKASRLDAIVALTQN